MQNITDRIQNMTNTTFLAEAQPLIDFIISKGGPKFPDDICLKNHRAFGDFRERMCDLTTLKTDRYVGVLNSPACVATVCMWTEKKVSPWAVEEGIVDQACVLCWDMHHEGLFETRLSYTEIECCSECNNRKKKKDFTSIHADGEEASLVLLKAICEALGYEGGES